MRLRLIPLLFALACTDPVVSDDDDNNQPPPDTGVVTDTGVVADAGQCVDLTVFEDSDGDGYGVASNTMMACLAPGEELPGFARRTGDCEPADPLAFPGSEGICGDFVDDNCDAQDEMCPTTQQAGLDVPNWDCSGPAPTNVLAYGRFNDGNGYYQDGGCFIFFEGMQDEFYVLHNLQRVNQSSSCESPNGCVCPSLNNWASYDRRIYAYTTDTDLDPCEETYLVDHAFNEALIQPVSNDCRRYLYQMHFYDIPYNFVGSDEAQIRRRLQTYETLEVSCIEDRPHANLPYQELMTTRIQFNGGFTKK